MKSKNKYKLVSRIKRDFRIFVWIFITLLAIESFMFRIPYYIVLGISLIIVGFLFLPWLDRLLSKINISLNLKNKFFIIILNLFFLAYLIDIEETSYYKCILPIILMLVVLLVTMVYSRFKNKKG